MRKVIAISFLATILASCLPTKSVAQNYKSVPGRVGLRGASGPVKNKIEFENIVKKNMEILKKPVPLPGIPSFTGCSKFLYGQVSRENKGQTGIAMRFSTNASPEAVTEFYRQGLKGYGWKVETTQNPREVAATKGHDTCRVSIYPKMGTGSCDFYISAQLRQ